MPDTQQALFTIALPPAPVARVIDTTPVVWSADVQLAFDVARYRLERSRALWFVTKFDGYSTSTKHGTVYVPEGNSIRCAKESYERCRRLWSTVQSVPGVRHLASGMANTLFVNDVATKPVNECLCLKCLRRDLALLVAAQTNRTEIFHFSSDDELNAAEQY